MSYSPSPPHVLVFPFPAQGHLLPTIDLVRQLAIHGLTITILITPRNLPIIAPLLSSQPSIQTLVLPFPHHPSIPPGIENVKDLGNAGNSVIIAALSNLHHQIIQWFRSHPTPPIAIISDFFLGWTQDLASQIGIPRIVFYSSGAIVACIFHHIWNHFDTLRPLTVVSFPDLPMSPSFTMEHLPSVFRRYRESDPDWVLVRRSMVANASSWGHILNTFHSLEGEYVEAFMKLVGHHRVYSVGPVNLLDGHIRASEPGPDSSNGVLSWLDGCDDDGSVLYVCFGSQKFLKQQQMNALADGLEQSGVKFIWVVKPPEAQQLREGYGLVPEGFEARVSDRGLVIKGWAPQVSILSHRAVGGFLSHCGWNSVLEAIIAGVMILGWPMEADQFINARLMVDYAGVAIRLCEGEGIVPNSAELAQIISKSMRGDTIEKIKTKELREKAFNAIEVGGTSTKDLEGVIREVTQLQIKQIP